MKIDKQNGWLAKLANNCKYFHASTNLEVLEECGFIQVTIVILLWYFFGVIQGFLVGLVLYLIVSTILDQLGYEWIKGIDAISAHEIHPQNIRNCGCKYFPFQI